MPRDKGLWASEHLCKASAPSGLRAREPKSKQITQVSLVYAKYDQL